MLFLCDGKDLLEAIFCVRLWSACACHVFPLHSFYLFNFRFFTHWISCFLVCKTNLCDLPLEYIDIIVSARNIKAPSKPWSFSSEFNQLVLQFPSLLFKIKSAQNTINYRFLFRKRNQTYLKIISSINQRIQYQR